MKLTNIFTITTLLLSSFVANADTATTKSENEKIPFEQYQNFAIRTGINKQIQEKTFRDTASESSEHMHRRKTTMGMRGILDKFHNVGDGGRANKRQRKE